MLKRYSPGAAVTYLRDFYALDYFTKHLREDANERELYLLTETGRHLQVELIVWAKHINGLKPTKATLVEMIRNEKAGFWTAHCERRINLNSGFAQVISGATKPDVYAKLVATNIAAGMLGD